MRRYVVLTLFACVDFNEVSLHTLPETHVSPTCYHYAIDPS